MESGCLCFCCTTKIQTRWMIFHFVKYNKCNKNTKVKTSKGKLFPNLNVGKREAVSVEEIKSIDQILHHHFKTPTVLTTAGKQEDLFVAAKKTRQRKSRWQQTRTFPRDNERRRLAHFYLFFNHFMRESDVSWWQLPPPVVSSQYLLAVRSQACSCLRSGLSNLTSCIVDQCKTPCCL